MTRRKRKAPGKPRKRDRSQEPSDAATSRTSADPDDTTDDSWPSDPKEQALLLVSLHVAGRWLLRLREPDPIRLDRIVDDAVDKVRAHAARGEPVRHPRAYFRTLVLRAWRSRRHYPQHRSRQLGESFACQDLEPEDRQLRVAALEREAAQLAWLRTLLPDVSELLTPRQTRIFEACLSCSTVAQVVDRTGEEKRNLLRAIQQLGRRILLLIERGKIPPPSSA